MTQHCKLKLNETSSAQFIIVLERHQSGSGFCPLVGSPPRQGSESWLLIGWNLFCCAVVVLRLLWNRAQVSLAVPPTQT